MQLILSKDNKSSYRRGISQLLFIMTESLVNRFIFTSENPCSPDSFIWKQSVSQESNVQRPFRCKVNGCLQTFALFYNPIILNEEAYSHLFRYFCNRISWLYIF